MEYLEKYKETILERFRAGMSVRRIGEIYGGKAHDIERLIKKVELKAISTDAFAPPGGAITGVNSQPMHQFYALSPVVQNYAFKVVKHYEVPVIILFRDMGNKQMDKLVRGCFFHGLDTRYGWSCRQIGLASGRSRSYVSSAITLYIESRKLVDY